MEGERKRRWWLWVVLALLVVYPLSIGPVWWLYQNDHWSKETYTAVAERIYPPLWWCNNHCKPMAEAMRWYISLWAPLPKR